ncbi:MAG: hypothetical protein Q9225_006009 [Loekoesia sp. 1 TL-2023]
MARLLEQNTSSGHTGHFYGERLLYMMIRLLFVSASITPSEIANPSIAAKPSSFISNSRLDIDLPQWRSLLVEEENKFLQIANTDSRGIKHGLELIREVAMVATWTGAGDTMENVQRAQREIIKAYTQNDQGHAKVQDHRGQLQAFWGNNNPESGYSTSVKIVDPRTIN